MSDRARAARLAGCACLLAMAATHAAPAAKARPPLQDDRRAEIALVSARVQARDPDTRAKACRSLGFSGIDDPALFDRIEARVLADVARLEDGARGAYGNRALEQAISWCAKALAYSGLEKYRPTLERLADSRGRFDDHAAEALGWIADFARWNAVINSTDSHRAGQSWPLTRALNLLRSGEPVLQKEGLKALEDLPLPERDVAYAAVAERLRAEHTRVGDRSEREDALAWHAKALGRSGDPKHASLLERVADEARSAKVRKHARHALDTLDALGD